MTHKNWGALSTKVGIQNVVLSIDDTVTSADTHGPRLRGGDER